MLGRGSAAKQGAYMRRGLEPMAARLGLDPTVAFFSAPTTSEARVLDAFRCGQSLLMYFAYPEGWPATNSESRSQKLAKDAAKTVYRNLVTDAGANAVAHMAQGYAHGVAHIWRRAAESGEEDLDPDQLRESADRSEALGKLVAEYWPVADPYGALEVVNLGKRHRVADLDNPHAMIDLHATFTRIEVACGGAALALGAEYERYQDLLLGPIAFLDLNLGLGLGQAWNYEGEIWRNLLSANPLPYVEVMRSQ